MSMFNSAHAGSQINLLCMIYRTISANEGKYSIEEISKLCRPENLPTRKDHRKRFGENLSFWMEPSHQLWDENENSKLRITRKSRDESPSAIAEVTNDALFAEEISSLLEKNISNTEGLLRSLCCILASDRFLFNSQEIIDNDSLQSLFSEALPTKFIPNNAEKPVIQAYGYFLGYLEKYEGGYVVDPTRVIRSLLPKIFFDKAVLSIKEFLQRLSNMIPILDGGNYRIDIEKEMQRNGWQFTNSSNELSESLSTALGRLEALYEVKTKPNSDDVNQMSFKTTLGTANVSEISYLKESDS